MDFPQIPTMAEHITVPDDSFIKSEIEDALPGDNEKPFDISSYLFVKCEDVPLVNSPSMSAPRKFEYNTQESEPKCSDNQEVEDALSGDNEKPFDIPNYLFVKCEDVPLVNSPGISAPCIFEYNTQELEPKCSDNQGHFSPHESGLYLQGNTSLVVLEPSTSGSSNSFASEYEAKGLENQKVYLNSRLKSKKLRKLEGHQRTHKGKKTFKCEICDKTFSRGDFFKQHQRVHTGEKRFKCDVCEKTFSQAAHLNTHKRLHTGEKPFKCNVCDKTFSQAAHLKIHQRLHTGEKPFKCNVCDKTFSLAANLNRHQKVHTGEKPFKCDVCDKTFSLAPALKQHQRVHTGEKPFKCVVCDKTFSHAVNLNTHQRVHTGEKPFKCDLCDKTFSRANVLKQHQRVHTGDKPFQCNVCDKTFSQAATLNAHQRVHTGEKLFKDNE
ncbi:zinc finger protein 287-like [Artemia franciscana]|uniref:zinc finger protein 287-like n=1 Tax=Artemia franciscana TaxID=6661 RepID=UPI0032DA6DB5